jgi:hypothetical protein
MTPPAAPARYKNHRFPGEIISHGVWLYYRFPLADLPPPFSQMPLKIQSLVYFVDYTVVM